MGGASRPFQKLNKTRRFATIHKYMLPNKLSFVDIETTGGSLSKSRIIEVAIIRVENEKVTDVFNSLINPQDHVPKEILDFTGIDERELELAPTFYDLKDEIFELLNDSVFVAHNVRFDYAFLKKEFGLQEVKFNATQICTVKLSRKLFPNFRKHNLDAIIDRFNFQVKNRHRALDDATVIWEFFERVKTDFSHEKVLSAINSNMQKPSVPLNIPQSVLDELPETPGVYIFYGQNNLPIYIGKSINLKRRVLSHFSGDHIYGKDLKIAQQINRLEIINTAGEFGALIKEAELIKQLQPLYNKKLRRNHNLVLLNLEKNEDGYEEVKIVDSYECTYENIKDSYGIFTGKKSAKQFLQAILKEYNLCDKLLGLEKTSGSCFSHKLNICSGACIKNENPLKYNIRLYTALSGNKVKNWPFEGFIEIIESNEENSLVDTFTIENWGLKDHNFDLDTYKIIYAYLNNQKNAKNIKIIKKSSYSPLTRN